MVQVEFLFRVPLSCSVIGNTSDAGSEEWEFETLQDNEVRYEIEGLRDLFISRFSSSKVAIIDQKISPLYRSVIGNTSDFGSEESGFEPQRDNQKSSFYSFLAKNSD